MSTWTRRYRSATSTSIAPPITKSAEILHDLFDALSTVVEARLPNGYPDLKLLTKKCRSIARHVESVEPPSFAQDDLRRAQGLHQLLDVLRAFSGFYNPQVRSAEENQDLFDLLDAVLAALSAALRLHLGNKRYFKNKVDGGGWVTLEQIIASIGLGGSDSNLSASCHLFGKLLAFALANRSIDALCQSVAAPDIVQGMRDLRLLHSDVRNDTIEEEDSCDEDDPDDPQHGAGQAPDHSHSEVGSNNLPSSTPSGSNESDCQADDRVGIPVEDVHSVNHHAGNAVQESDSVGQAETTPSPNPRRQSLDQPADSAESRHVHTIQTVVRETLRKILNAATTFEHVQIIPTVVGFWEALPRGQDVPLNPISVVVLEILHEVCSISLTNLEAVHQTGVLSRLIRVGFSDPNAVSDAERSIVLDMCKLFMPLGVNDLADTQFLLSRQDPRADEFCLEMTKYHGPSLIQFDLSVHGYSCIEIPNLQRPFPPLSTPGYTFTAWIYIDQFDPQSHTTIFGIYDPTQTCFLLAYLELDSRTFILQTSVTAARPSVRFKSFTFNEGTWYHVAVVHKKAKNAAHSKASLFVNGEFVEQQRPGYPNTPPASNSSTESFASFASINGQPRQSSVQAFLGTPRRLASQIGPGIVHSKWSLASAHLFEDILSDDLIAVHYQLGPRYQGNYQDCLGGFQTYSASASLGLRNEVFHAGKHDSSEILKVIRDRASTLMPESKILLSMIPSAVFSQDNLSHDCQLFRCLSRDAVFQFYRVTQKVASHIALNAAHPFINDALCCPESLGRVIGEPLVIMPKHIDDSIWELGGFTAVVVRILERSSTPEELLRSLQMTFSWIRHSWRNSEAIEHGQGYSIIGMILRAKLGFSQPPSEHPIVRLALTADDRDTLSFNLLYNILEFVGYNHESPIDSFIINPLAFRILLVDFDTWRKSAPMTQELYYKQFTTFAINSKYHDFNARRLLRMRIVKRLLDAVKGEPMIEDVLPFFMATLESLITCQFSSEVHRALALFITYAFHSSSASLLARSPRPSAHSSRASTPQPRRSMLDPGPLLCLGITKTASKRQLGKAILELYARLLFDRTNKNHIEKFARTVTNKVKTKTSRSVNQYNMLIAIQWLLYLLSDSDPDVVVYGAKILCRLLVTNGPPYIKKFKGSSGGFHVMAHRLKRWWGVKELWPVCFCLLFGVDAADLALDPRSDSSAWASTFVHCKVVYGDALSIIMAMLQQGLKEILKYQDDPESPMVDKITSTPGSNRPRARSAASLSEIENVAESRQVDKSRVVENGHVIQFIVDFLHKLHAQSIEFREFCLLSDYMRLLCSVIYPAVVGTDPVTPEMELHASNSVLSFEGGDVIIRPAGAVSGPIVRTSFQADIVASGPSEPHRGTPLRRASSYYIVPPRRASTMPNIARFNPIVPSQKLVAVQRISTTLVDGILGLLADVYLDQILVRKEFPGFRLADRIPPGFREHQAYFASFVLKSIIPKLEAKIKTNQDALHEPRILGNIARLHGFIADLIFAGWFIDGASAMTDLAGMVLEYLQRPDVASLKSVRLCSQAVSSIKNNFLKVVILQLSEIDGSHFSCEDAKKYLDKLCYWQTVLLECLSPDDTLKLFWYQLYIRLVDKQEMIRRTAVDIWRIMLVQKPDASDMLFREILVTDQSLLARGFKKLVEIDNDTFLEWADSHRPKLDSLFFGGMSKSWEEFVSAENARTVETAKSRATRRKDKLRMWDIEWRNRHEALNKHDMGNTAWMKSVYNSERGRYQRLVQDQQDDIIFLGEKLAKMDKDLRRPGAAFSEPMTFSWKLDRTEGRNRMRLRILPETGGRFLDYQPKRKATEPPSPAFFKSTGSTSRSSTLLSSGSSSSLAEAAVVLPGMNTSHATFVEAEEGVVESAPPANDEDFELVDDPNDADDAGFEDKNRKVMRQLMPGDAVENVWNICRIVGLEANEGILILGKVALYMLDNVFHRSDGEIVNAWEAPKEERDPFVDLAGGSKASRTETSFRGDQDSRYWKYEDILSVSRRRYLFRDVAIEIFFTDGRSYLLTLRNQHARDEFCVRILSKAPHTMGTGPPPNLEDSWRLEALRVVDEAPQSSLGAKFGNFFQQAQWNAATRKWQRGEISNFHYLMLINTMAGRTFNDLTQYPVFPWVLADYTSEELDLKDPKTFRDLRKPMGAQTAERRATFDIRYKVLAEGEEKPFHYGTHYSSAMIVASYLIRIPPFVQSFILLQGGTFDHPDRLFYSIAGAWLSASQDNATDVRELVPEFFYLPEFLENINHYNFGERQGNGGKVDSVELPLWAHGDPKIFIAKHREALESPFVSRNLHHWIDLIFGYKQKGDAAVENTNVFHYLSYHGAKDLDNIDDPVERAIVTSTIHNFGQTPHQIFTKPHPKRDISFMTLPRLDTAAEHLKRLPHCICEADERVTRLTFVEKRDQLLCSNPFRINLPPHYDKFLEWGYADCSVRFYNFGDKKPAGIFENLHNGQISCVVVADSRTLVTAGEDCVVSVHLMTMSSSKLIDLAPRQSLFGHKSPVNQIAVSRHFSTMVTISLDGQAFVWDLNRLEFVRKLNFNRPVEALAINEVSGEILLCAGPNIVLFTLNGDLILDQNICPEPDDYIHCCAFYEGLGNEWLQAYLIFTGHGKGVAKVWRRVITGGRWKLELVKTLDHVDGRREDGGNYEAPITAIAARPSCLYTGDDSGRLFQWNVSVMK